MMISLGFPSSQEKAASKDAREIITGSSVNVSTTPPALKTHHLELTSELFPRINGRDDNRHILTSDIRRILR